MAKARQNQSYKEPTAIRGELAASQFRAGSASGFKIGRDFQPESLANVMDSLAGVGISAAVLKDFPEISQAMDTIAQPVLPSTNGTPLQFLQQWLAGIVELVTAPRNIDKLVGRQNVGNWGTAEIVQQVQALTGAAGIYSDTGNIPLASYNPSFVTRAVVIGELGLQVSPLEVARAAAMRIDSAATKRRSVAINLEVLRNRIGFYGYNNGLGRTYGFLNEPNLPAYVSAPNGNWATASYLEIQQDLLTILQDLRTSSNGLIDPSVDAITIATGVNIVDFMNTTSDFGNSVGDWLKKSYPNVTIVSAPELNGANGGQNVIYAYADRVADSGTDDQSTFVQLVQATFQLIGMEKKAKGEIEDFANATAGVLLKRPFAVRRYTGF